MADSMAFVIVTFNSERTIAGCLASIAAQDLARPEVVVVDNGSWDNTVAEAKRSELDVRLIENESNMGFACACNIGVAATDAELIMLLNPDAELCAGAAAELQSIISSDERIGIVGPRLRTRDGELLPSAYRYPTAFQELAFLLGLKPLLTSWPVKVLLGRLLASRYGQFDPHLRRREVETVVGACMLIRRSVWEILGGFDERFFMFYEEKDFCKRAQAAGFRTVFVPEAEVVHEVGASTSFDPVGMAVAKRISMLRYYDKNKGRAARRVVRVVCLLTTLLRISRECLARATGSLAKQEFRDRLQGWGAVVRESVGTGGRRPGQA